MATIYYDEDLYCPACQARLSGTSVAQGADRPPQAGDITVCAVCATLLCFDAAPIGPGLYLRRLRPDERARLERQHPQEAASLEAVVRSAKDGSWRRQVAWRRPDGHES